MTSSGIMSVNNNPSGISGSVTSSEGMNSTGILRNEPGERLSMGALLNIHSMSASPAPAGIISQDHVESSISPTAAIINPFVVPPRAPTSAPIVVVTQSGEDMNEAAHEAQGSPPAYSAVSSPEERVIVSLVADSSTLASGDRQEDGRGSSRTGRKAGESPLVQRNS